MPFDNFLGCEEKRPSVKTVSQEDIDALSEKLLAPDEESVVLLSKKYNIDEIVCRELIKEYDKETSSIHQFLNEMISGKEAPKKMEKSRSEAIYLLSIKHNISEKDVASILMDYKTLQKSHEKDSD